MSDGLFDKPIDVRPPVGRPPKYLESEQRSPIPLAKSVSRGGLDQSAASKATALQVLQTVGDSAANLVLELQGEPDQPEVAYQAILDTTPLREEVYAAFRTILRSGDPKAFDWTHTFFEDLLGAGSKVRYGVRSRLDNDVIKYFTHECFVGFIALAISEGMYGAAANFMSEPFYKPDHDDRTGKAVFYTEFMKHIESFEYRNAQKKLNRISLHADVIAETHQHSIVVLDRFLEADFILYVRGLIASNFNWFPVSAVWLVRSFGALRIFARAQSAHFYDLISPLLFGTSADDLRKLMVPYLGGDQPVARFDYETLPLATLMNLEKLATTR